MVMKQVTNLICFLFVVFSTLVLSKEKTKINPKKDVNQPNTHTFFYTENFCMKQNCMAITISTIS